MLFDKLLILCVLFTIAHGKSEKDAKTVYFTIDPVGNMDPTDPLLYRYSFETDNGIRVEQNGRPKNYNGEEGLVVRGVYSYTAPDGKFIKVSYVADKNGYRVFPQPPPPQAGGGFGGGFAGGVSAHCLGSLIGCNIG